MYSYRKHGYIKFVESYEIEDGFPDVEHYFLGQSVKFETTLLLLPRLLTFHDCTCDVISTAFLLTIVFFYRYKNSSVRIRKSAVPRL